MRLSVFRAALPLLACTAASAAPIDYARDVRPILATNCFHCHGQDPATRKAGIRLDTAGGQQESAAIDPGRPDNSELIARILSADADMQMPPPDSAKSPRPHEKDILRRWIQEGAQFAEHWAFTPPVRPAEPAAGAGWARNAIDRFVAAQHAAQRLSAAPAAPRSLLARRVALDLTGLPLSPAELDAFLADSAPDAYERLVDRLLASPRYGEHLALSWLDLARYADTNGYQMDAYRMNWPWRDWVVDAFNANLPFDRFTIEQLAGDLLPNATRDQLVATAFNRNHMLNAEGGTIAEENRTKNVFDRVDTTATAFLGLTLACAQCHDHKFDPLTQKDYYALYAMFNQLSEPGGVNKRFGRKAYSDGYDSLYMVESPFLSLATPEQDAALKAATARRVAAEKAQDAGRNEFHPVFVAWIEEMRRTPTLIDERIKEEITRRSVGLANLEDYKNGHTRKLLREFLLAHAPWRPLLEAVDAAQDAEDQAQAAFPLVMIMRDDKPRTTRILERGNYETPGAEVAPAVPAALARIAPLPDGTKPDRLALARWLVSPAHPLFARVTVNRFWQQLFGRGLVKTAEDFGLQGELPTHPELLDWLAVEFRESGWDVKHLLRLLVTSATYRQAARQDPAAAALDPDNAQLTRGPRFRLDSRTLRDQALHLSGLLVEKRGGFPVMPYQPPGIWEEMSFGKNRYFQGRGEDLYRRSLYTFWRRSVAPAHFFDVPSRQVCSVKPFRTSTPLHALTTLNDPTYVEAARVWASRLAAVADEAARLRHAFRAATGRTPAEPELAALRQTLARARTHYAPRVAAARELIATGEAPPDGALPPVEHAAWTTVCLLLLNLDETLNKP